MRCLHNTPMSCSRYIVSVLFKMEPPERTRSIMEALDSECLCVGDVSARHCLSAESDLLCVCVCVCVCNIMTLCHNPQRLRGWWQELSFLRERK